MLSGLELYPRWVPLFRMLHALYNLPAREKREKIISVVRANSNVMFHIFTSPRKQPFLLALRRWPDVPRETSSAAKSEEKLLFSQATLSRANESCMACQHFISYYCFWSVM